MAGLKGIDFVIQVDLGTVGTPDYQTIAGQRGGTLHIGNEEIDTSSKDSSWEEKLVGLKNWSISGDGLYSETDDAFQKIEDEVLAGNKVRVRMELPSGRTFSGEAIITSFDAEAPHDAEATASVELMGSGELTKADP